MRLTIGIGTKQYDNYEVYLDFFIRACPPPTEHLIKNACLVESHEVVLAFLLS